jgi:hypothetical protein
MDQSIKSDKDTHTTRFYKKPGHEWDKSQQIEDFHMDDNLLYINPCDSTKLIEADDRAIFLA